MMSTLTKDLQTLTTDTVEHINTDVTTLTREEKLRILENDSPELLRLLPTFRDKIIELRERIHPILAKYTHTLSFFLFTCVCLCVCVDTSVCVCACVIDVCMKLWDANNRYRVKSGELPTSKGVSYLEVKNQLLLNYCINLCFYMALKASGRRVKDHPVISQLLRIRTLLEKLRPLDQKLRYQIDKLLKIATLGHTAACTPSVSLSPSLIYLFLLYISKNRALKSVSLSLCVCVCVMTFVV
jgi:hypothetical protein